MADPVAAPKADQGTKDPDEQAAEFMSSIFSDGAGSEIPGASPEPPATPKEGSAPAEPARADAPSRTEKKPEEEKPAPPKTPAEFPAELLEKARDQLDMPEAVARAFGNPDALRVHLFRQGQAKGSPADRTKVEPPPEEKKPAPEAPAPPQAEQPKGTPPTVPEFKIDLTDSGLEEDDPLRPVFQAIEKQVSQYTNAIVAKAVQGIADSQKELKTLKDRFVAEEQTREEEKKREFLTRFDKTIDGLTDHVDLFGQNPLPTSAEARNRARLLSHFFALAQLERDEGRTPGFDDLFSRALAAAFHDAVHRKTEKKIIKSIKDHGSQAVPRSTRGQPQEPASTELPPSSQEAQFEGMDFSSVIEDEDLE